MSVVIPAYRCAQYIAQAVESVFAQSYGDYDVVVVNDGSPDTASLEAALRPFRDRIQYIRQDTGGPSAARNRGILESRGKYVAFLDGDDYWGPDHLAKQMQLLSEDPRLDLVYCDCVLVKNDKPLARAFSLEPQASQVTFDTILLEECAIGTSTVVVSRDALLRAGLFDEAFRRCEDFELWLRLAFGGSHIAYHSDAEVFHRVWEQGLSADRLSMKKDRIRVYEKLAASLPLSEQQHSTLDRLTAETRRDCDLDVLKVLLGARDYSKALLVAQRAQAQSSSWKIRVATLGLRFMPRLFGSLFRLRKRMVRDLFHDARLSHHGLLSNDDIAANDTPFVESSADREELQGISSGP